jgi:DNA-binding LacI/PurR family transcriptional regulator
MILAKTSKPRPENTRAVATSVDVARLAGVTQATVSRAINKPETVSLETRRKIEQAMASLHYKPSAAARVLARGKNGVIGLIIHSEYFTAHRVGLVVEGIAQVLDQENFLLSIAALKTGFSIQELEKSPLVRQHSCDGLLICIDHVEGDLIDFCRRLTVPYIIINPPAVQPYDCILPDDQASAELAVNFLVAKGHRRIAYLSGSPTGHPSILSRQRGYEMAMYRAGLQPWPGFDVQVNWQSTFEERQKQITDRLLSWCSGPQPVTAILTYDVDGAVRVARAAYLQKWFIPERLSVMSCDDEIPLKQAMMPIHAIDPDRTRISIEAVRMLLEKMADPGKKIPTRYIKGRLVERDRYSVAAI